MKITMFGVSNSGKTCYLCAMANLFQRGVEHKGFKLFMKAAYSWKKDSPFQKLAANYQRMSEGVWPENTSDNTEYSFGVQIVYKPKAINNEEYIPEIQLFDYAGGLWTDDDNNDNNRDELTKQFADSSLVLFLVDGNTLIKAMNPIDRNTCHKNIATPQESWIAEQRISFVQSLFDYYKHVRIESGQTPIIPPVMVMVTKKDVFADTAELERGKALIIDRLPSIFAIGSHVDAAITSVSLGESLGAEKGKDDAGDPVSFITGDFCISTQYNIHIPIVYAICTYLSDRYEGSPKNEQEEFETIYPFLQDMMKGKVDMFRNGYPLIAL